MEKKKKNQVSKTDTHSIFFFFYKRTLEKNKESLFKIMEISTYTLDWRVREKDILEISDIFSQSKE